VAKARVDGAQMEQALLALARHALLVMGPGGRLSVHAANVLRGESTGLKTVMPAGSYVRVSLEFAGAATHGELLEPWLEPAEASREIELGVAAAYQIVRQSEGDLTVDGRSIHLYLPAVLEAEAPVSIPAPGHVAADMMAEPAPKLETILVVEDEGGIRALVRKILLRQGYDVLEAAGGDEALELLAHSGKHVDLLLTDVMMPGMNGIELSRRAVAAYSPLKVLFVSGYTDESVLEAGQFPAGTAFLQKPFTLGSLLGKVREVLDGTSARHAAS
jgi:CheY-like chemotaxis protein